MIENYTYVSKLQLRIKYNGSSWSQFWTWSYGGIDDINNSNINSNIDNKFVLAWGGNQNNQYITSQSPSNVYNLSTYGDVQVSNAGSTMGDMKISAFNKNSAPYYFTESPVTQGLYKAAGDSERVISKGICITTKQGTYRFDVGGIRVNGGDILFTDDNFNDTVAAVKNGNKLETQPFNITDNSDFNFLTHYFPSPNADKVENKDNDVSFKVKLLDASTGNVLGVLSTEDLSSNLYKEAGLNVNTKGIGSKLCKLQLEYNYGGNDTAVIYNSYETNSKSINKKGYNLITYRGGNEIKSFALDQNYPNPFNPATTISYQLPKAGVVSLKVYDMLGREVAVLAGGVKEAGYYNASFNGGNLSSGVYIYRLSVKPMDGSSEFISVKKLMLLK